MSILSVRDLCKTYIVNKYSNNVLRNISFDIDKGEFISIMGPSGSGKSTLLYTVSGMDNATSGEVFFNGKDIGKLNKKEMSQLRLNNMGFIFQQMHMLKKLCIIDNIVFPGYQSGKPKKEVNSRAEMLMRRLGVIETAERNINEVSGGELQRACLCRALINQPDILFADEPTGALNSAAANDVMKEFTAANNDGTTILMVTHSERVAARSDRVLYLVDGGILGELDLGKMNAESELIQREKALKKWLSEQNW